MPRVSQLFIYPIKSAAGTAVDELALDELGAENDRRWMLIDTNGKFITQREHGALARIRPRLQPDGLLLQSDGHASQAVSTPNAAAPWLSAVVWEDTVRVLDAGARAAEWCSDVIGAACRLVFIAPNANRPLNPKYAGSLNPTGRHVALSDGAPVLLLSEASLDLLNERLSERNVAAVGMNRFRPNIVLSGTTAHEEDAWRTIRVGDITFGVGSPCPRCVMTTIEQHTGRRALQREGEAGGEPLRTLAQYRREGSGVMFGMNATNATGGVVKIGDEINVETFR